MAFSPNRRTNASYLHRKQVYTYNRQQNVNQANLTQFSPSIRSPKLNQQSQYTKHHNSGLVEQLKTKLQTVLKHNSHLLNENATLSQMVNNLKMEIDIRNKREESEHLKFSIQFTTTIQELREHIRIKQTEIVRLLDQISRLHSQAYQIQLNKNNQIKRLTQQQQKQLTYQIRNIKKANQDGKQLVDLQIKKLKQSIEMKNFQLQAIKSQSKSENDKLRSQLQQTKNQIKHFNQLKDIQVRQINQKYKQYITTSSKQVEREKSIAVSKLQSNVRKLKQQILNKNVQIEQTSKKSIVNSEQYQLEIQNLQNQRQRLLEEINQLQISNKQNVHKQKLKSRELSELQIKNLQNIAQNQRSCLKSQIGKLLTICQCKTEQIKKLYNNISQLKATNLAEKKQNDRLIEALKKRIKILEQDNLEQVELLKIKMAKLHQSDIKGLQQFYQNEIALLVKRIKQLEQQKEGDRDKIHKGLQQNDLLRKTFQTELTKYKAKIQDYKIKMASANLQFREQITSLGTKMQLTSQTLLRQAEQKQKGAQFFEAQKKKFHLLILGKDKQIATAYQTTSRLKQLHLQQVKQLKDQIANLRQNLSLKVAQMKDLRKQLEQQFDRKSQKIISQRVQSPNEKLIKQNKQLRDKIELLQKQLFQKIKEIQFSQRENKSLQQQIGLRAGFLQTMQLQSSAAIEDERSKLKILMNENEVAMKDYYETKIANKNKDISALQSQLHEKQTDIRQLIVKYNQLQKRLKQLLDSQERLSQFEKKIVNLGLDQNLVKNMGELFAKYRK